METMGAVKLHEEEEEEVDSAIAALGSLFKLTEVHLSSALFSPLFFNFESLKLAY